MMKRWTNSTFSQPRRGARPGRAWAVLRPVTWLVFTAGLTLGLTLGCTQLQRPEQAEQAEKIEFDELLHEQLQSEHMVTVAEACRVMVMLAEGDDPYESFAEREAALIERSILRPEWSLQRDDCIDKGSVAYMTCRILNLRGGLNYSLLGGLGIGDRRYAVRELVYLDLMPEAPAYRYVTGAELVDLIGKADRYMAAQNLYEEEPVNIEKLMDTIDQRPPKAPKAGSAGP